jgi:ABC-type phosphate transport system substrate-binding protein
MDAASHSVLRCAALIRSTPFTLGYVSLGAAQQFSLSFASMVNKAGNVVSADALTVRSAILDYANTFTVRLANTFIDAAGLQS